MNMTNVAQTVADNISSVTTIVWPLAMGVGVALIAWGYAKLVARRAK